MFFENQQTLKESILLKWDAQIPISHPHGNNKEPKISSGDGLGAESTTLHQTNLPFANMGAYMGAKSVHFSGYGMFPNV